MLIVNADDWGLRQEVTEAIAECWEAGAITAASAMVEMADSARAFELATARGLPLGLHLNLTFPFDAATSGGMEERQRRALDYFAGSRWRRYGFDPRARAMVDRAVGDQLVAFTRATGASPRHADGHQHIQVCPTVFSSRSLRALVSLREAQAPLAGGSRAKALYRAAVNRAIRSRFRSLPFYSLRDVHPSLGGAGFDFLRKLVKGGPVELMTHPAWDDERRLLLSEDWLRLLAELPTGTHEEVC